MSNNESLRSLSRGTLTPVRVVYTETGAEAIVKFAPVAPFESTTNYYDRYIILNNVVNGQPTSDIIFIGKIVNVERVFGDIEMVITAHSPLKSIAQKRLSDIEFAGGRGVSSFIVHPTFYGNITPTTVAEYVSLISDAINSLTNGICVLNTDIIIPAIQQQFSSIKISTIHLPTIGVDSNGNINLTVIDSDKYASISNLNSDSSIIDVLNSLVSLSGASGYVERFSRNRSTIDFVFNDFSTNRSSTSSVFYFDFFSNFQEDNSMNIVLSSSISVTDKVEAIEVWSAPITIVHTFYSVFPQLNGFASGLIHYNSANIDSLENLGGNAGYNMYEALLSGAGLGAYVAAKYDSKINPDDLLTEDQKKLAQDLREIRIFDAKALIGDSSYTTIGLPMALKDMTPTDLAGTLMNDMALFPVLASCIAFPNESSGKFYLPSWTYKWGAPSLSVTISENICMEAKAYIIRLTSDGKLVPNEIEQFFLDEDNGIIDVGPITPQIFVGYEERQATDGQKTNSPYIAVVEPLIAVTLPIRIPARLAYRHSLTGDRNKTTFKNAIVIKREDIMPISFITTLKNIVVNGGNFKVPVDIIISESTVGEEGEEPEHTTTTTKMETQLKTASSAIQYIGKSLGPLILKCDINATNASMSQAYFLRHDSDVPEELDVGVPYFSWPSNMDGIVTAADELQVIGEVSISRIIGMIGDSGLIYELTMTTPYRGQGIYPNDIILTTSALGGGGISGPMIVRRVTIDNENLLLEVTATSTLLGPMPFAEYSTMIGGYKNVSIRI